MEESHRVFDTAKRRSRWPRIISVFIALGLIAAAAYAMVRVHQYDVAAVNAARAETFAAREQAAKTNAEKAELEARVATLEAEKAALQSARDALAKEVNLAKAGIKRGTTTKTKAASRAKRKPMAKNARYW